MNTKVKYDENELEILQAYVAGKLEPVPDMYVELKLHKEAAEATFKKDQRLNIRISTRDIKNLQAMSLAEGIPY